MSQSTSFSGTATATEWLSAYVFTSGSLRDLLVEHVAPLVDHVLSEGLAERFFFIRYWEGGPHLRLRFERPHDAVHAELERRFPLWAAQRLDYVEYEPETERYGGPEAIGIAEDCFALSSRVALQILRDLDDDGARGAAMLLHVALAHAFGMTRAEAVQFFENVSRARAVGAKFETVHQLPSAPRVLWDMLDSGDACDVPWLQEWIDGIRAIAPRLKSVRRVTPLISILDSYVHMTSNRLGVLQLDEPYVAFLLSRTLAQ